MNDLAVVLSQKKSIYAPMADAILKTSSILNYDVKFYGDDLSEYKNIIIFDNCISRINSSLNGENYSNLAWWMNDLRSIDDLRTESIHPALTHIFLCNKEYLQDYNESFNVPVSYMPQCGHEFYRTNKETEIKNSIIFIGNLTKKQYHYNRKDIINTLSDLGLWMLSGKKTTYSTNYIYKNTPISLAISLPYQEYTSNRLYNILASEGFALTLYYPGIEKQFTNHEHLVWFKSPEEAKELAKYYLSHIKERKKIAKKGHQLYLKKHRMVHRIQNMYDIMNNKTNDFYGYNI